MSDTPIYDIHVYRNDNAGQVFGMHIVQSRKYERAAADLILTRTVLGGQLVVFGTAKHEEEDQLYNVCLVHI